MFPTNWASCRARSYCFNASSCRPRSCNATPTPMDARGLRQVPASLRNPEALYFELEAALGVAPTSLERPEGEEASRQGPRLGDLGREVDRLVHMGRGLGEIPFRLLEERHLAEDLAAFRRIRMRVETALRLDEVAEALRQFVPTTFDRCNLSEEPRDALGPRVDLGPLQGVPIL